MKWALGLCLAGLAWSQSAQTVDEPPLKPGLYAVFNTSKGKIVAELYEKYAPVSVKNFVGLAEGSKPWYDPATKTMVKRPMYQNMIFHRALQGVMIQSGDPTGTGHHNCGFTIRDEFLPGLLFDHPGRVAVANTGQPNSGACQFFITLDSMKEWNGAYSIFGQVVSGMDVVSKINRLPMRGDRPIEPATLDSVTIERIAKVKK
jgi:peptidyl-prolyl cis-trans isomerase A (cyclophilin A)